MSLCQDSHDENSDYNNNFMYYLKAKQLSEIAYHKYGINIYQPTEDKSTMFLAQLSF